jgi:predicted nucleic acid-binding protein
LTRLVVDTSVALAWVSESQATPLTRAAGERSRENGAVVPFHFHLELSNALLMLERRGRMTAEDVEMAFSGFAKLSFQVDREPIDDVAKRIFPLARTHHLTIYDAAYLELALRTKLPLATRDRELRAAAVAAGATLFAA